MFRLLLPDLALPLRVLLSVPVLTPTTTCAALPWVTARLEWFQQGRPAPWTRAARSAGPSLRP